MITVTERAAAGLQEVLEVNHARPGYGVKLVPRGSSRIGLAISVPSEGDQVVQRGADGEAPLLIVDRRLTEALDGAEIDCERSVVDGESQTDFTLRRSTA